MSKKLNKITTIGTIIALFLALLCGFVMPNFTLEIKPIGDFYIQLLKFLISPIIFLSINLFVLKSNKNNRFLLGKTVLLFILMFVSTYLISSLIVFLAKPGNNFTLGEEKAASQLANFGFKSILLNLVPTSFRDLLLGKYVFFVILVALLISFIISKTKLKQKYLNTINLYKKYCDFVLNVVILFTPLAVLSLVSNLIVSYDISTFKMGLTYILFAYGLSLIAIILIMILPVWIFAKINPIKYIAKASKVWLMTIATCSSAATLPYTIKVCNEDFEIDEKITDIVVPLGCTIHMCGGAVSFSLLGIFVAQISGVQITLPMFLLMLLSATLINMAAPGIPGGGVVIGITYLSIFGFPFEIFYGMYIAIYKLLDMAYTTLNVTGDITANILLNHNANRAKQK